MLLTCIVYWQLAAQLNSVHLAAETLSVGVWWCLRAMLQMWLCRVQEVFHLRHCLSVLVAILQMWRLGWGLMGVDGSEGFA